MADASEQVDDCPFLVNDGTDYHKKILEIGAAIGYAAIEHPRAHCVACVRATDPEQMCACVLLVSKDGDVEAIASDPDVALRERAVLVHAIAAEIDRQKRTVTK
jgi:hypothetical protein